MKNGRLGRIGWLLLGGLYLVSIEAHSAEYWTAKRTEMMKRDLELQKMYARYDLERDATPPGATIPKNKSLTVPYNKSRMVELTKNAKKATAAQAAMWAAVAAAGWAIDELTKQVTEVTTVPDPDYQPGYYWNTSGNRANLPTTSCQMYAAQQGYTYTSVTKNSSSSYTCYTKTPSNNTVTQSTSRNSCSGISASYCTTVPPGVEQTTNVPDPTVVDQVWPYISGLPDYQVEPVWRDERGIPIMTPELKDAINTYNQDLADNDPNLTWDPQTGTFTYTDPTTQEQTSWDGEPETTENTDTSASDQDAPGDEWPDFCSWAQVVCDWANWQQEEFEPPPPEALPFDETNADDYRKTYSSGLGSGSCPAPYQWSYGGYEGQYSFETACMAASTYFYPILLAMAGIMAAYIIAGASRKGN